MQCIRSQLLPHHTCSAPDRLQNASPVIWETSELERIALCNQAIRSVLSPAANQVLIIYSAVIVRATYGFTNGARREVDRRHTSVPPFGSAKILPAGQHTTAGQGRDEMVSRKVLHPFRLFLLLTHEAKFD